MVIALLVKHKMHMARTVRMPLQELQESPYRSIMRDRIWHRHNRLKPEYAVMVALHNDTPIWSIAVGILHIVEAFRVRFPNVDFHIRNGLAGGIFDSTEDKAWFAFGVM